MAPKKRKGGTAQRDRSDSEAVASDATTSTVSAAAPARKSAKSSKASTRGRSGSAGSSTTGRSRSRDVESEFDNEYEDEAAFQAAVSAHDVNALKIISPISIDRQSKLLKRFKEFLAAAMDRKDSKEKRLEAADALIGRDKPLPAVTTLLEFLTFWAKGSKSKMVEGARMNHASFEAVADQLMTALSRAAIKPWSKEDLKAIKTFLFNSCRGPDPLVRALSKEKKTITYADMERLLAALFDRREGPFKGRSRASLQAASFMLLIYAFGVRPGAVLLRTEYADAEGETQCLLFKDVELFYEGYGVDGEPTFTAKVTFRWMKGMRDHQSENLVVRLRSLPRAKAHFDLILYLLAQAQYRGVLKDDILAMLESPDRTASPSNPVPIHYTEEGKLWPVFTQHLDTASSGMKRAKSSGVSHVGRKRNDFRKLNEKDDKKKDKVKGSSKDKGKQKDDLLEKQAEKMKQARELLGIQFVQPALTAWATDAFRLIKSKLDLASLTPYDFRRGFAMAMRSAVSVSDLQYLMGHRPGSFMVDKRYIATDRDTDTTAARFGVDAELSDVGRNSVSWGLTTTTGSWARVNKLAEEVKSVMNVVEKRFGSVQAALEQDESDADLEALMDLQALLLSEVGRSRAAAPIDPVSDKGKGKGKAVPESDTHSTSLWSGGTLGFFDIPDSAEEALPDPDMITFRLPDANDIAALPVGVQLPAMPEPAPGVPNETEGDDETSTGVTLDEQLREALDYAANEMQHPLSAVACAAKSGKATLASIQYLVARLQHQDLTETGLCLLCFQDGTFKYLGDSYDKHVWGCENKHLKTSHIRCGVCSAMVIRNEDTAAHLSSCYGAWKLAIAERLSPAVSDSAADNGGPTEDAPPPASQLSHISEVSDEEAYQPEDDDVQSGDDDDVGTVDPAKKFKNLCRPLTHPRASFAFLSSGDKVRMSDGRPLCPICLDDASRDWTEDKLTQVLPLESAVDWRDHYITHFQTREQVSGSVYKTQLDWDTEKLCGLPGCTTSGTLHKLVPHWQREHDLPYVKVGPTSSNFISTAQLPQVLKGNLKWQHQLGADEQDTLCMYSKKQAGNAKQKTRTKKPSAEDDGEGEAD